MNKMGQRIKAKREERGMTQEELGKKLGVLRQTICKWENGDVQNIKRSYIEIMADIFHCDPVWLMAYEGTPEVKVTHNAPTQEDIMTVDHQPITGKSAEMAKRSELYQAVLEVAPENYDIAIKLLKSLSYKAITTPAKLEIHSAPLTKFGKTRVFNPDKIKNHKGIMQVKVAKMNKRGDSDGK